MALKLRRPVVKDIEKIKKIAESYDFLLPENPLRASVIERDNEVVAFGLIRILAEAILISSGSKKDKAFSLFELISQAIRDAKDLDIPQLHVFVKDDEFADILIKHFKFKEETGKTLVLSIEKDNK